MPTEAAYLFLEISVLAYMVGFGWELWSIHRFWTRDYLYTALGLALFWFVIDEIAIYLGLWTFPEGGTLSFRVFSLPIEEYLLFFFHTIICFIFVTNYNSKKK